MESSPVSDEEQSLFDKDRPYIGDVVTWTKSGRAAGEKETGKALMYVPPGTSNEEAIDRLRKERLDLVVQPTDCSSIKMGTSDSHRAIVAVIEDADPANTSYADLPADNLKFYAPNYHKLTPTDA